MKYVRSTTATTGSSEPPPRRPSSRPIAGSADELDAVRRDGHEALLGVVDEVDAERARADELLQELLDVAHDGADAERRVELEARDVEVREALELRFDLGEAVA